MSDGREKLGLIRSGELTWRRERDMTAGASGSDTATWELRRIQLGYEICDADI